jgi:hypothetical protein
MEIASFKYFENQKAAWSSDISYDRLLQERLLRVSDKLTSLA